MGQSILWPSLSGVVRLHGVGSSLVLVGCLHLLWVHLYVMWSHSAFYLHLLWAET